jgi:hypothetical protein
MENLVLKNTEKTPMVEFNTTGELHISGRSISENPMVFFKPLSDWLATFAKTHPKELILHIKLEYFNTSSSKVMLNVFRQLEHMRELGIDAKIYWYYDEDDEEIYEAGKGYETLLRIPYRFIELAK